MSSKLIHIANSHIYGLGSCHLVPCESPEHALNKEAALLHKDASNALNKMRIAAKTQGITLNVASGHRSFSYQQGIWERKFNHPSLSSLDTATRVQKILKWSALPGTSRHHWGSDVDIYDSQAISRTQLALEPWEYEPQGPCFELFNWLENNAAAFGFYRPYDKDRGGVAPEPWHWSYLPLAEAYLAAYKLEPLKVILSESKLSGFEFIEPQLTDYIQNYVYNVAQPKPKYNA